MKSRVRNATKENARYVQHDARCIGVSEQPEPVAGLDSELSPENNRGRPMAAGQGSEVREALPTLVTWRRFLFGVLPGIGEDEVTNHSLVTRVSFTRFALEKLDGFAVESQSYLLFLVQFAHQLIERSKLALSQGAQISNDLALIVCVSNRFFLHRLKRWNRSGVYEIHLIFFKSFSTALNSRSPVTNSAFLIFAKAAAKQSA